MAKYVVCPKCKTKCLMAGDGSAVVVCTGCGVKLRLKSAQSQAPAVPSADPPPPPAKPQPPKPRARPKSPPEAVPRAADTPPPVAAQEAGPYPWEIPAEVIQRVQEYDAQEKGTGYPCQCGEFLNYVGRNNVFAVSGEADWVVYPDMVGILPRGVRLGGKPISGIRRGLALLLGIPMMILGAFMWMVGSALQSGGAMGCLIGFPLSMILTLFLLPFILLYALIRMAFDFWEGSQFPKIAARIRQDPKSTFAVRKMHRLCPLAPRFWQRGDVAELVRVDVTRPFPVETRYAILVAQAEPVPRRPSFTEAFSFLVARRRVYVVWFDKGPEDADQAATAAAQVLGVSLHKAKLSARDTLKPVEVEAGATA